MSFRVHGKQRTRVPTPTDAQFTTVQTGPKTERKARKTFTDGTLIAMADSHHIESKVQFSHSSCTSHPSTAHLKLRGRSSHKKPKILPPLYAKPLDDALVLNRRDKVNHQASRHLAVARHSSRGRQLPDLSSLFHHPADEDGASLSALPGRDIRSNRQCKMYVWHLVRLHEQPSKPGWSGAHKARRLRS